MSSTRCKERRRRRKKERNASKFSVTFNFCDFVDKRLAFPAISVRLPCGATCTSVDTSVARVASWATTCSLGLSESIKETCGALHISIHLPARTLRYLSLSLVSALWDLFVAFCFFIFQNVLMKKNSYLPAFLLSRYWMKI